MVVGLISKALSKWTIQASVRANSSMEDGEDGEMKDREETGRREKGMGGQADLCLCLCPFLYLPSHYLLYPPTHYLLFINRKSLVTSF